MQYDKFSLPNPVTGRLVVWSLAVIYLSKCSSAVSSVCAYGWMATADEQVALCSLWSLPPAFEFVWMGVLYESSTPPLLLYYILCIRTILVLEYTPSIRYTYNVLRNVLVEMLCFWLHNWTTTTIGCLWRRLTWVSAYEVNKIHKHTVADNIPVIVPWCVT